MTDGEKIRIGHFLNQLKWATCTEDDPSLRRLDIDCFLFSFRTPMCRQIQYAFLEYMETLDLENPMNYARMGMWLLRHSVEFRLRFRWSKTRPVHYNLRMLTIPRKTYRAILCLYSAGETDF